MCEHWGSWGTQFSGLSSAIGKQDRVQTKLTFNKPRSHRSVSVEAPAGRSPLAEEGVPEETPDVKTIITEVRFSLRSIDSKIYTLTHRLDRMHDRVDKHEGHIDHLEQRVSACGGCQCLPE